MLGLIVIRPGKRNHAQIGQHAYLVKQNYIFTAYVKFLRETN